jgi:hypothetical protein
MRAPRAGRFAGAAVAVPLLAGVLAVFPPAASAQGGGSRGGGPAPAAGSAARLVPAFEGLLDGVVATSPSNAWAVGDDASNTLIVHWNGSAWKKVPAPNPDPRNDSLTSISAVSASDIWAVGNTGFNALVVHWNGKAWRRVSAPHSLDSDMFGVAATSATNAWAVGDYSDGTVTLHTLVEHWDGKAWRTVAGPSPRQGAGLFAVAARSASLAFAVGDTESNPLALGNTFLEEWNGHVWREVTSPTPFAGILFGVTFSSARSAWTVGSNDSLGYNPNGWTLIEHWNGTGWG